MSVTKIILCEKIRNLGKIGDIVEAKSGFVRNFLIPQGLAVRATDKNISDFNDRKKDILVKAQEKLEVAKSRAATLNGAEIVIRRNVRSEGKLFGSISSFEVVDALASKGIAIKKKEVDFGSEPIKEIGEYEVDIVLHEDVCAKIKLIVEPDIKVH